MQKETFGLPEQLLTPPPVSVCSFLAAFFFRSQAGVGRYKGEAFGGRWVSTFARRTKTEKDADDEGESSRSRRPERRQRGTISDT